VREFRLLKGFCALPQAVVRFEVEEGLSSRLVQAAYDIVPQPRRPQIHSRMTTN